MSTIPPRPPRKQRISLAAVIQHSEDERLRAAAERLANAPQPQADDPDAQALRARLERMFATTIGGNLPPPQRVYVVNLPQTERADALVTKPTPEKFVDDYLADTKAAGITPSMRGLLRARDDDERSRTKYGCSVKAEPGFGRVSLAKLYRAKGLKTNRGGGRRQG